MNKCMRLTQESVFVPSTWFILDWRIWLARRLWVGSGQYHQPYKASQPPKNILNYREFSEFDSSLLVFCFLIFDF